MPPKQPGFFAWLLDPETYRRENFGYETPILSDGLMQPGTFSLDPAVLGTNVLLALLLFLVVGSSSALFNNVLEDYRDQIEAFTERSRLMRIVHGSAGGHRLLRLEFLAGLALLYALIASYINPAFSLLSLENLGIWGVMTVVALVVSYTKDIVRFVSARMMHSRALFLPHLGGILLVLACVVLSRSLAVAPGFIYGIPIGFYVFSKKLEEREAPLEFLGLCTMLAAALVFWFVTPLIRDYQVLFDLGLLLTVVLVEGAFFELVPMMHNPGIAILRWRKAAWFGIGVVATFLLFHTLFNPNSSFVALADSTITRTTVFVLLGFSAGSFLVWGVLRMWEKGMVAR